MHKKLTKKLWLGILTLMMVITTLVVMPTDAQAAKKTKKTPNATIDESFSTPTDNHYLIGQKGVLKKFPEQLNPKYVIKNRNKKAKYTFYAADKKKLTISKRGKITAMKGYKDGDIVKIIVKETYKKKTRKVGVVKYTATFPKITKKKVTWYAGHSYYEPSEWWMTEYDDKESLPFYSPGAYLLCYADKPWTKEDIAKMTTKLNEETEDEGTNGEETDETENPLIEWNAEWNSITVKDAGHLYVALFALDYSPVKFYYVGDFEAELIKWTQLDDVSFNLDNEGDWVMDNKPYCLLGRDSDIYYTFTPECYYGRITATSSDPSIAAVTRDEEDGHFTLHGLKEGTVTITIEADGFRKQFEYRILSKKEYDTIKNEKIVAFLDKL